MLEWKKKFFTNIIKIREKLNKSGEEKYGTVLLRLHENEDVIYKAWQLLEKMSKKETEIF